MKTIKFLKPIIVAILTITMVACVDSDEYDIPAEADASFNAAADIEAAITAGTLDVLTISQIHDLLIPGEVNQITSDVVVMGYVVSSDETGNFYQEFYMQDAPSNPTAGVKVALNLRDNYITYNIGRKVYIKLKDLYVGETNNGDDVVAIGGKVDDNGTEVDAMTENQIGMHIVRSNVVETIIPQELSLAEINASHIGTFVMAIDVEFADNLDGELYFDPTDQFDSQRTMQSCNGFNYSNFILETSGFASFKDNPLPNMNGNIAGVISKTYNGSALVMALNTPNDVNMTSSRCSLLDINDFSVEFEDDFSTGIGAWTSFSVDGSQVWGTTSFGNPGPSARMSGYSGGAQDNEDWLISPAIDMSALTNGILLFETVKRYSGPDMQVYMSTDYAGGDPTSSGTWTELAAAWDTNTGSWSSWTSSGSIDVSAADGGDLFVAFKYTSSPGAGAATFELENVKVLGL